MSAKQKKQNWALSQSRVVCEYAFARVKCYNAITEV
ncbi:hypothetical protein H6F76_17690 [Leptolyngbya sp. FACHB-321]|nr:hypothetical protein [Leptolyngbya sp. FACHB-321]